MAGSVNRAIIVGNVGKDPEIRRTQDGRAICNLSVATSESWKDKSTGERREKTEWHRIVIFNEHVVKTVEQYVKKGMKVYVEGSLQTRKWTDKDSIERYSTEIVIQGFSGGLTMLDRPKQDDEAEAPARKVPEGVLPPGGNAPRRMKDMDDMDDSIPF